jgi:hypothetical protein
VTCKAPEGEGTSSPQRFWALGPRVIEKHALKVAGTFR